MGETEEFDTLTFEKKMMLLKDTQESIQSLSSWCLRQRTHHKKIVSSWLNVLKRVKVEQRLVLFYLANDVIQYSKRKNYEFVESWGLNLQKATPLVRDEKVRPKILRIFKIWEQRSVYDDEFLSDLTGLLSAGATKKADDDALDFQPQQLVNKIKQCAVLEADTDMRLKCIHESHLQLSDADALCANLKDRSHKDDVEKELNEGISYVERYTQSLQREIVAREALLALLSSASQYYSTQRGEVKVVAYAYKNFGARVRALKRKLDMLVPTLPHAKHAPHVTHAVPSPPRRDEDVPSPGPDEDLELPAPDNDDDLAYDIDQTFNTTLGADGSLYNLGLSSFLSSDNPMSLFTDTAENGGNTNKIEVINSRPNEKQDFNINDFLKTLIPADNSNVDNNSVVSGGILQKNQETLPGLDLLTPESTGNPVPPSSFYGSIDPGSDEPDQAYNPERNGIWSGSNMWNVTPVASAGGAGGARGAGSFADAPESPPQSERAAFVQHAHRARAALQDIAPVSDVDHRGLLPPPPPPPVLPLLGEVEDVDHRLLPALSPMPPVVTAASTRHPTHQDVDHRNLIPLTHQPPVAVPTPRPILSNKSLDQDYRVPPVTMPTDIVESVDMDLSEDEDQHMYSHQQPTPELVRRNSFNNNKVLVGGDNGKVNHDHMQRNDKKESQSAPVIPTMVNPFESMPLSLQSFNPTPKKYQNYQTEFEGDETGDFDEDLRSRGLDTESSHIEYPEKSEWQNAQPRPFMNQRFPRHWTPRTNYRPQFGAPQFWPRNGPRPPNRWNGPRQRFW